MSDVLDTLRDAEALSRSLALLDWFRATEYRRRYEVVKRYLAEEIRSGRRFTKPEIVRITRCVKAIEEALDGLKLFSMFPDDGPYRRQLYPKHLEFMAAGARFRERLFMAANRVGKTTCGAFEVALHLTGLYPPWWEGRRFSEPVRVTVAGKTNEQTRDIIQERLFGRVVTDRGGKRVFRGDGMVPRMTIGQPTWKQGIADFADVVPVLHVSGGWSRCWFRSYQQGRGSFEGTSRHVIWLDEEPPEDVYDECLMRTTDCGGIVLMTFTPLNGVSGVVRRFLPEDGSMDVFGLAA